MSDQYIYFLELHGKHPLDFPRLFKIGLSGDPDDRLANIQHKWREQRGRHVSRIKLVKVWDMDASEARLHRKFKADRVYARNHPVFTGKPISGDTEWFYFPYPWDVFAAMRAMDAESIKSRILDWGVLGIGVLMITAVGLLQYSVSRPERNQLQIQQVQEK